MKLIFVLFLMFIAGCGGGASTVSNNDNKNVSDMSDAQIAGFYTGFLTVNGVQKNDLPFVALISEVDKVVIVGETAASGELREIDKSAGLYELTLSLYENPKSIDAPLSPVFGVKTVDMKLKLTFGDDPTFGAWGVDEQNDNNRINISKDIGASKVPLGEDVFASWMQQFATASGSVLTNTLSIDEQGNISGNDTNGCNYQGNISNMPIATVAIPINLSISACGELSGSYEGLASVSDFSNGGDLLHLFVSNNAYGYVGSFTQ